METVLLVTMNLMTATALGLVILVVHLVKKVESLNRTAEDTHQLLVRNMVCNELGDHPPTNGTSYPHAPALFRPPSQD